MGGAGKAEMGMADPALRDERLSEAFDGQAAVADRRIGKVDREFFVEAKDGEALEALRANPEHRRRAD